MPQTPNLEAQLSGPPYMGPATFMKVTALTEPEELDQSQPDVAIVGAPWDGGTTSPPRPRLRARGGAIGARVAEVASRKIVPIVIGGDHSITYPSATAVADAYGRGKVGMVHFDAHADTGNSTWGDLASHATPMRRLIESGAIPGPNFVQIGLRGYWPERETFEWMKAQGMRWHLMGELLDRGVETVIGQAIQEALDGPEYIYLSVDIDVLDPGFAPAAGTPEPGGRQPADLLRAVRNISLRTKLVGMDLVEVAPPYDHAEITSQNANRCMLEAISALAVKKTRGGTS